MTPERYTKFEKEELILRDQLAIDRTILANDRTILSFARTALTLAVAGASVLRFFEGDAWQVTGWSLALMSLVVFAFGLVRYWRVHQELAAAVRNMSNLAREAND